VNNFETGEWLAYTVNVATSGNYDIELRAATDLAFPNAAYHVEIDAVNMTGSVVLPTTGGWGIYQWIGKKTVPLTIGQHVLKIVSDRQYFNLNSIRITASVAIVPPLGLVPSALVLPPSGATRAFFCTFNTLNEGGFIQQAAALPRATIVNFGRDGNTAVRLHTEPGDGTLSGDPARERNDVFLTQQATDCYGGREQWWEHSILFPDDFVIPPPGNFQVVLDFHANSLTEGYLANLHIDATSLGTLQFRGFGGVLRFPSDVPGEWSAPIGPIVKNAWYDFVYHLKWSSGADGFFKAWVNGKQVVDRTGPTLYLSTDGVTTIGCYLKLANYHSPFGQPQSVIHDRVIRYWP
jgi:hypothetical protein